MLTSHKNSLLINVAHTQWLERLAQSMLKFDRLLLGFIELDKFHLSRCTVLTVIILNYDMPNYYKISLVLITPTL